MRYRAYHAGADGRIIVQSEEMDRIELRLAEGGIHNYSRYTRTGDELGPLPIGSRLDATTGAFTWQPGVGFVGSYDLLFVRWADGRAVARKDVRVVFNPMSSGRVGAQVVIDTPTSQQEVGQPFVIAGWWADFDQTVDSGMAARPDVAAFYGNQYRDAGYGLMVQGLAPGTYDLAVFAWSTVRNDFVPARVVRVTVR